LLGTVYDAAMNSSARLRMVLVAVALAACSGEEALHSSPPCPDGQHQECEGDEDSVRCECVADVAEGGSAGSDASDAGGE
jgi:hypothetical protein